MWETRVQFLSWEDLLEEGMAAHSSILAWRIPMDREACPWATIHGVAKSQTRLSTYSLKRVERDLRVRVEPTWLSRLEKVEKK